MSALEVAANLLTAVSIVLAGRNSLHTWWTGIVGSILFLLVFFQAKLYADVTLQIFFIVTSVAGWWQWLKGQQGAALDIGIAGKRVLAISLVAGIIATIGYGALLHRFTDAYAPFIDSAVLVLSVTAQMLLIGRKIENWPFWIAVNSIAVPLYASRGLYLTSALYAFYWVNACYSLFVWRRMMREQAPQTGEEVAA